MMHTTSKLTALRSCSLLALLVATGCGAPVDAVEIDGLEEPQAIDNGNSGGGCGSSSPNEFCRGEIPGVPDLFLGKCALDPSSSTLICCGGCIGPDDGICYGGTQQGACGSGGSLCTACSLRLGMACDAEIGACAFKCSSMPGTPCLTIAGLKGTCSNAGFCL
jgi:hypothetical protein